MWDSLKVSGRHWSAFRADVDSLSRFYGRAIGLREILLLFRDMDYRRPSGGQTVEACISEWCGTCSTKHLAVHELLRLLGYHPKLKMACFRIPANAIGVSDEISKILSDEIVYDVHNWVECDLGKGSINIDVTFPLRFAERGFIVTKDWDEELGFRVACLSERVVDTSPDLLVDKKREWLDALNVGRSREVREAVIQAFMQTSELLQEGGTRFDCMMRTIVSIRRNADVRGFEQPSLP